MLKGVHADAMAWLLTRAIFRENHVCLGSLDLARVAALKLTWLMTQGAPDRMKTTIGKLSSNSLKLCA
jgi:hypothetical protein